MNCPVKNCPKCAQWEYHHQRCFTKREVQELKKKKGVVGFDVWLFGEKFRRRYNCEDARDYYIASWRTRK